MKKTYLLIAALAALSMTANAQEAETDGTVQEAAEAVSADGALSDSWSDFQIQIDDQVYQFPMTYEEFTSYGWSCGDDLEQEISPYEYGWFTFEKDGDRSTVYILNLAKNNLPADECIVGGIDIDTYYWEDSEAAVTLPGGIVWKEADVESIKEKYGTPSDTYEGDSYTELTYQTDSYSRVELTVDKESGVLEEISVRNFTEPEGFDAGEISEEVPESVLAYEKPEELTDDMSEYQILLDGEVYALPVPVSVMIADGWELDENDSDMEVMAESSGWVTLRKGGQEIRELARNEEGYATIPQNCWVEELTVGGYTLEAEGMLPGGIEQGMPEEEFIRILEDNGVEYEASESGDYVYYNYSEKEYGQSYQVVVTHSDSGHFPINTVMEITCSNTN